MFASLLLWHFSVEFRTVAGQQPRERKDIFIRGIDGLLLLCGGNTSQRNDPPTDGPLHMETMRKTILPILLATAWISLSEFARNEFVLRSYWIAHYERLGLLFPSD